ncbi:MAG: hypothetical protein KBD06_01925 [Candidatus Pacebacteria bacterium]|nr:hypothetical protein [Candidatus Paceibacterota bacterium]
MSFVLVNSYRFVIAVLVLGVFSVSAPVFAHDTGFSYVATSTPYVVDVGYDPAIFVAGDSVRFDLVLNDERTGKPVTFDQVWVRITSADGTLLATGLYKQPFGPTTLLYTFALPGSYELQPSFRDASGKELAVSKFPIQVSEPEPAASPVTRYATPLGLFVAGVALGIAGTRALRGRSRG